MNTNDNKGMEGIKRVNNGLGILMLVIIVGIITVCIKAGLSTQPTIFIASIVAVAMALCFGSKWSNIQKFSMECISDCGPVVTIMLLVGVLVGIWIIGGSIPSVIYYGLKIVSPSIIVPMTFILCILTSVFTGTSYGSIATSGLAMLGVGVSMGISPALMAGAIVSGAYFGDKMSPMSDTTNLSPAMAGTTLYKHIGSMMYTTIPATIVALVLYVVVGLKYSADTVDYSSVKIMMSTLSEQYNISLWCIIPMILVLVLAALKVPAILAMGSTAVVSVVFAVVTQHAGFIDVLMTAMNGYVSETGEVLVDSILTRGGIKSMIGTISIIYFTGLMAGALKSCGIFQIFEDLMLKVVKSTKSLIVSTLVFSYAMVAITGNQVMGIIVPGQTMGDMYDKFNVHRKVLSRCLEDAGTLGAPMIPWSAAFAYIFGVLGVGPEYIPYAFLCFLVPVFSIICAFTGFGVWDSNEKPVRGKKANN